MILLVLAKMNKHCLLVAMVNVRFRFDLVGEVKLIFGCRFSLITFRGESPESMSNFFSSFLLNRSFTEVLCYDRNLNSLCFEFQ